MSQHTVIEKGFGKLLLSINEDGLVITTSIGQRKLAWNQIIGCYLLKAADQPVRPVHPDLQQILPFGIAGFLEMLGSSQQLFLVVRKTKLAKPRESIIWIPIDGVVRQKIVSELKKYLYCQINDQQLDYWQVLRKENIIHNPLAVVLGIFVVLTISVLLLFGWWAVLYFKDEPSSLFELLSILSVKNK